MSTTTKALIGGGAAAFALLVLATPSMLPAAPADSTSMKARTSSLGARTIANATPAELAIIRSGPITIAGWNTAAGWRAACLRKTGATLRIQTEDDGRVGYSVSYSAPDGPDTQKMKAMAKAIDRCYRVGEAVQATYFYDHIGLFSGRSAYPGLGAEVKKLRAQRSG